VDQEQQRDHAEEAANKALLHEEEEYVPSSVAEAAAMCGVKGLTEEECPYTATLERLDLDSDGIAVRDPSAELEFYVDPPLWPELRQLIDTEYQKWLETAPNSPRANRGWVDEATGLISGGLVTD
jgi:hypothetical protein